MVGPFLLNDTVSFLLDRDLGPSNIIEFAVFGTGRTLF
jgi:hypothetical protein